MLLQEIFEAVSYITKLGPQRTWLTALLFLRGWINSPTQYLQLLNVLLTEVSVLLVLGWWHKPPELISIVKCFCVHLQLLVAFHPEKDGTQLDLTQLHLVLQALARAYSLVVRVQGFVIGNQSQDVCVDLSCFLEGGSLLDAVLAAFDELACLVLELIEFAVITDWLRLLG